MKDEGKGSPERRERRYNPVETEELGRNAARALLEYPAVRLPPDRFPGAGIYTIHYQGEFEAYQGLTEVEPIYVGKAEPPGRRQGRREGYETTEERPILQARLREHAESIEAAVNLNINDFLCRWLVLDKLWIPLTEEILLTEYRPIWNAALGGFGNHDPGKGRRGQKRSAWDTLHPGRQWAAQLQPHGKEAKQLLSAIATHRSGEHRQVLFNTGADKQS